MNFFTSPKNSIRIATLPEWLDWAAGNPPNDWVVELPMIQRGFVWKPLQIIELWDTLLQGLPIGALLVTELSAGAQSVPLVQQQNDIQQQPKVSPRLGLLDGQQRTLAMLAGWPLPPSTPYSLRIWVDFADTPRGGDMLRLRITTRNQPFGFGRDTPNTKLSLAERRRAQDEWRQEQEKQAKRAANLGAPAASDSTNTLANFDQTRPYSGKPSLALDLRKLLHLWHDQKGQPDKWKEEVLRLLKDIEMLGSEDKIWDSLAIEDQELIAQRINTLATGLERLHSAEVPLVRVDSSLFDTAIEDTTEPPLALLFKRIGSNFTKLSDEDYVYAILKQLLPEVHHMVNKLHGHRVAGTGSPSVASLLTPTDLAMSALRLATAEWNFGKERKSADPESPSKEDFHSLIRQDEFLKGAFLPLLTGEKMQQWFDRVLRCIEYRQNNSADAGLPHHALPHLSRPLVQVLLRLAQIDYLGDSEAEIDGARRSDVLRLVLYWWQCVTDQHKASRIAYQVMEESRSISTPDLGRQIKDAIVKESASLELQHPECIRVRFGLEHSGNMQKVLGWSRFAAKSNDDTDRRLCEFWSRWWWPLSYQHPILLWLQRGYVGNLAGDPIAGRDEDTPYDYDHILPQDHWGYWTGSAKYEGRRFIDHLDAPGQAYVIGNSIGNVRVWASSDNRSDGAAAPARKLHLIAPLQHQALMISAKERKGLRNKLLDDSAIEKHQVRNWFSLWVKCPRAEDPQDRMHRDWTLKRAKAFERAVETRALALYQRFWDESGFSVWSTVASADAALETDNEGRV